MKKIDVLKKNNLLFDKYNGFLKKFQKEVFIDYYHSDYSICEIAERRKVSRQFISQTLKELILEMESFEKKIGLVSKSIKNAELLKKLKTKISSMNNIIEKQNNKILMDCIDKLEKLNV